MDKYLILSLGVVLLELIASITGFVHWKKIKDSYWKWFPVYLLVLVLAELVAIYAARALAEVNFSGMVYRYFAIPLQFLFYFWLFYQYLKESRQRKWPLVAVVIYVASWVVEITYFMHKKLWFMSFSYTVGNVMLLVLIILFLIRFIFSQEILQFKSSLIFWVNFGLLIFYLGTFPFYALRNTLYYEYKEIFFTYGYINFVLDYLMYAVFTFAFIWAKPK